jgi:hypothetical protein
MQRSWRNTTPGPDSADFDRLEATAVTTKLDETAAALEKELQRVIDSDKEDKFYLILAIIILFDVIAFKFLSSWPESLQISPPVAPPERPSPATDTVAGGS